MKRGTVIVGAGVVVAALVLLAAGRQVFRGRGEAAKVIDADKVPTFTLKHKWLVYGELVGPADERVLTRPTGLAVDRWGNVYVADSHEHRIMKYDSLGRFLQQIGRPGQGPGELLNPGGLDIDEEGFIYVVNNWNSRIEIYWPDGSYCSSFSPPDFAVMHEGPIAVSQGGEVFLSFPHTGHLVAVFSRDGKKLREFGEVVQHRSTLQTQRLNSIILVLDRSAEILHVVFRHLALYRKYTAAGQLLCWREVEAAAIRHALKEAREAQRRAEPGQVFSAQIFLAACLLPDHSLLVSANHPQHDVLYRFSPEGRLTHRYLVRGEADFALTSLRALRGWYIASADLYRGGIGVVYEWPERR